MKTSLLLSLALLTALTRTAGAQDALDDTAAPAAVPATVTPNPALNGASRVTQIEEGALSTLPALLGRGGAPGAISLRVSEEAFDADAGAQNALIAWVRNGGTVFLHTGAARAFGFQTVPARLGTNALAGQLYGRARAALPFGAHPLLWDDGKGDLRRAPGADPTLFPGVNVVFYQMQEGDHLVQSHPAGTPLLEAKDLSGGTRETLFAAALAPFGRGFAIFTPDFIDQNRGDGALFARNLLGLLSGGAGAKTSAGAKLVAVSARTIENGGTAPAVLQKALVAAGAGYVSPALPAFGTAPGQRPMAPAMDAPAAQTAIAEDGRDAGAPLNGAGVDGEIVEGEPANGVRAEPIVLLARSEANSYARLIAAGGDGAGAAINLLRARLFLGRGDTENAARSLEASAALAPESAEIALWRGFLQIGAAQNLNQPSPVRAGLVQAGARDLAQAAATPSLFAASERVEAPERLEAPAGPMMGATGGATLGGIPLVALRNWSVRLGQIAQVFALEPPLFQRFGAGDGAIIVRATAGSVALPIIVPGVQALAGARNFGWHGDNEEILLFPTPASFFRYRAALGLEGPTVPLPASTIGDVVGQRISMIDALFAPAIAANPLNGGVVGLGIPDGAANVLARLHSYVLLGAYDEGALSPAWLQLGLENLINVAVEGDIRANTDKQTLEQVARAGGLLTPEQFRGNFANALPAQIAVAQAQSAAMMAFFYRTYGAGAVLETVQRLGSGQGIDDALEATTEGDQLAFFQTWRAAQFGARRFPNQG